MANTDEGRPSVSGLGSGSKGRVNDRDMLIAFSEERHMESIEGLQWKTQTWRMKERMKTVSVALVVCLNVGVDPPDVVKTQPCARLECWIDPLSMSGPKALEKIGQALQSQYERWQPRARYKQTLDPTSEDVRKLCTSLRRNAKEERVLFHYNGHGVPKPTVNGEIWVFNRTFTQYIPLSIYDLQTWMGAPSIYVYDCSNAGVIVESFKTFAAQHQSEYLQAVETAAHQGGANRSEGGPPPPPPSYQNCIQLAACAANQNLPMNPDLPADLFTSCLTTPIKIALRWFVLKCARLVPQVTMDMVEKVPGQTNDRRTMLGELNWIFTAITDTIAWNVLPRDLFQKLFRQDLLVASLFRNFLLAERIMRSCDCTPVSHPALPKTSHHHMWDAWDLELDLCLGQLPAILSGKSQYKHSSFFEDQLTAFQVWLKLGSEDRRPPEQLPIVLQVLLSQIHRTRALELLVRFLDLGPWAVSLALSVGIFPYVLKLLQSCATELKPLLVYIWAKILALDNTCQSDLIRDQGHKYFLSILQEPTMPSDSRTQATFVLSCLVSDYREGQEAALQGSLVSVCLEQLSDPNPLLRRWVAICLGRLWDHYESARWTGVRDTAHEKLYELLKDPVPEVRAAAVYALGTFINSVSTRTEHANNIDHAIAMTLVSTVLQDASPLVRKELVCALQWLVLAFDVAFASVAAKEEQNATSEAHSSQTLPRITSRDRLGNQTPESNIGFRRIPSSPSIGHGVSTSPMYGASSSSSLGTLPGLGYGSVYMKIWAALSQLETDPHNEVARMGSAVTGFVKSLVKEQRDMVDSRNSASLSLPPSPNRSYLSAESPPALHSSGDFNNRLTRSALVNRTKRRNVVMGEDTEKEVRKPLVSTGFVAWSSKQFAESKKPKILDPESQAFHEKDWRMIRNGKIREEAREEKSRALNSPINNQVFHTRTAVAPSLLQLHPFCQQVAVAGLDSFAIWDWGTGAKIASQQQKSSKITTRVAKITALEWINGHDMATLMTAADDGAIRVWRPNFGSTRDCTLTTAWQAFHDFKPKNSGVLLAWEQMTQTVIATGDVKLLRFWDVTKELKAFDIPTGTEASVTCIDSSNAGSNLEVLSAASALGGGAEGARKLLWLANEEDGFLRTPLGPHLGMVVIGCSDGSVRVFDRRCPSTDARVKVWMEHAGSVLAVQLKDNLVISGSVEGIVKIYDIRKNTSLHTNNVVQNQSSTMSCMSIHRSANVYACGSINQSISIYNLNNTLLNTIRFYEGFMSHRIGPVSCLNFHPHKVALAAGTSDCAVNVYSIETPRR